MASKPTESVFSVACDFCRIAHEIEPAQVVMVDQHAMAFFPLNPATLGHTLIIPRSHVVDFLGASDVMMAQVGAATVRVARALQVLLQPEGMNMISSAGEAATQTVFHFHVHVVPRWASDRISDFWPTKQSTSGRQQEELAARLSDAIRSLEQ